jgi:hypothetical protein
MIESKYTIEYINPEDSNKTLSKPSQYQYILAFGGLALAALAYFLITLPAKKTSHQPKVVVSQQQKIIKKTIKVSSLPTSSQPLAEKITDKLVSTKPVTSSINKPNIENSNQANLAPDIKSFDLIDEKNKTTQTLPLAENLKKLKAQLLETQHRNKELATELDAQIMENMELATLLEDSLYKINKEDKSYIKELKKLEKNTVVVTTNNKINNKTLTVKTTTIPKLENNPSLTKKQETVAQNKNKSSTSLTPPVDKTPVAKINRVDLSTASQVNAIIANINSANKPSKKQQKSNPKVNIEASRVKLQDDINHMINDSKTDQLNTLQKSLNDI